MNLESYKIKPYKNIKKLVEENNLLKKKIQVLEKTQNIIIKTLNYSIFKYKKKIISEQNLETMGNLNEKINETDINEKEMESEMEKYLPFYKEQIEQFKKKRKNTDNGSNSIKKKQKINSEGSSKKKSVEEVSPEVYSSLYKLTIDSYIRTNWNKIKSNNIIKFRMKDIKGKESENNLINKLGEKVEQIMKKLWQQNITKFKEILFSKKNLGEYIEYLLKPKALLIVKSMKELIKKFNEYNKNSGSFVTYVTCKNMELLLSYKSITIVKNKGMCGEDGIYGLKPPDSLKGKKEYQNGVWYFPRSCFKLISII
jgi:hypothetical protein